MKSPGFLLLWPCLALIAATSSAQSVVLAGDALAVPSACHYDLVFQPKAGKQLVVKYEESSTWDYGKERGMSGKSTKTATLHWTFKKQKGQKDYATSGRFEAGSYVGSWTKNGKKDSADIVWTRGAGFEKGGDSAMAKKSFSGEMQETLAFPINRRGEAKPGEC